MRKESIQKTVMDARANISRENVSICCNIDIEQKWSTNKYYVEAQSSDILFAFYNIAIKFETVLRQ